MEESTISQAIPILLAAVLAGCGSSRLQNTAAPPLQGDEAGVPVSREAPDAGGTTPPPAEPPETRMSDEQIRETDEWLDREWRMNQRTWFARLPSTPPETLPFTRTLTEGELIRADLPEGMGIVVDLEHAGGGAMATALSFKDGKPRNIPMGRLGRYLQGAREHWITAFPEERQPPADQVAVYVDQGTVTAHLQAAPLDGEGRVRFPEALALGREPRGSMMNCGPERVFETGRRVESADAAVALLNCLSKDQRFWFRHKVNCDQQCMKERMQEQKVGDRVVYELVYSARDCGQDSFTIKVSSDGWVSDYGCCGI